MAAKQQLYSSSLLNKKFIKFIGWIHLCRYCACIAQ